MTKTLRRDTAFAAVLTVVAMGWTRAADNYMDPERRLDALGLALVAVVALVLAVRRRWPVAVLAVSTVLTSTYLTMGYTYGPILVAFLVAVYTVARHRPLNVSVPVALVALPVLLVHIFTNDQAASGWAGLIPGSAWVVVPFAIGTTRRLTRQSAEQARAEAVRQRVDDERLRMAQDVHDIVGHGLAAIKMQADVALHVLAKKPEQAEVALTAISRTSAEALDELRATLAVVRRTEAEVPRAPAPGLDRIEDLRRRMSEAGVQVELQTSGDQRELPPAVNLAGYRVVQESLTNALRHGAAKVATVRIGYETDAVNLAISNPTGPVPSPPVTEGGLGIPGMRQRVQALGGEFTAGRTDDGRFEVRASIPAPVIS